ncbi:MAG TPA: hypothetical protein VJ001_03590 [Rhodocyclaceae bacterium]|nr:hypothetical protein [Rhodocyclaceae bacterium]
MGATIFDAFDYAIKLRNAGMTEQQAEIIAKQTGDIVQLAVEAAKMLKRDLKEMEASLKRDIKELELATRRDLKEIELSLMLQIEKSKNSTLLWMFAMLTGVVGVMAKGFHWF